MLICEVPDDFCEAADPHHLLLLDHKNFYVDVLCLHRMNPFSFNKCNFHSQDFDLLNQKIRKTVLKLMKFYDVAAP